jgi:hypothetical protein
LLTDVNGNALAYRHVDFVINNTTYPATTGLDGVASAFTDPASYAPGQYTVKAVYAGDGIYALPSQVSPGINVASSNAKLTVTQLAPDPGKKIMRASSVNGISLQFNNPVSLISGATWQDYVHIIDIGDGSFISGTYSYDNSMYQLAISSCQFRNGSQYQILVDTAIAQVGGYSFSGYSSSFMTVMLASDGGDISENEIDLRVPGHT